MFTKEELDGSWASESTEEFLTASGGKVYVSRELSIEGGSWSITFTVLAGDSSGEKAYSIRGAGTLDLGGEPLDAPGARIADFNFETRTLTPHNQMYVDMFRGSLCSGSWAVDEEHDVSKEGCLFVPSVCDCPTEYDIVKLEDGKLYLGDRSSDLCDADHRPTAVNPYPLVSGDAV
ncbi:MAG TPA: hypothetical protein VIJ97_05040 [Candidatus Anoxymicrobiaceae bacterium]